MVNPAHILYPGVRMVPTRHRPTGWEAVSIITQNSTVAIVAKVT